MKAWLLSGVVAAMVLGGAPSEARAATETWYGTPGLVMDGAAVTTMSVGWVGLRSADVWLAGAGLHLVGAPIAHAIHGHPARALASLALRLGGMALGIVVGGYLGDAFARSPDPRCDACRYDGLDALVTGTVIGADVTAIGVSVIDASVLAYEAPHAATRGSLVPYVGTSTARTAPLSISLGESAPGGFISPRVAFAMDSAQHRTPVFGVGGRF